MSWWRLKLISWLWPRRSSWGFCANRVWHKAMCGPIELTLTIRDTRQPDGYERTELLCMLCEVRKHEQIQDWKVPE